WQAALSVSELGVPGGTLAQPSWSATRLMYSLPVAQAMNFCAASAFSEPAGTASDQAHSELPRLPRPASGASAKPTLSATFGCLGLVTKEAATVASIHMPHLPVWNKARL